MTPQMLLLVMVTSLILVQVARAEIDKGNRQKIEEAVDAIRDLDRTFSHYDRFMDKLGNESDFTETVGRYMRGLGPMVVHVFMLTRNSDKEFQKTVRAQFQGFDSTLGFVEDIMSDLGNSVPWKYEKSRFTQYTNQIDTFKERLVELSQSYSPFEKRVLMLKEYQDGYLDAGKNLKNMLLTNDENSIIELFKRRTNNKKDVKKFLMQCMRYMFEACEVEVAYSALEGWNDQQLQVKITGWEEDIQEVQEEMIKYKHARYRRSVDSDVFKCSGTRINPAYPTLLALVIVKMSRL